MTHGNQIRSSFHSHNSGHPRHAKYISLLHCPCRHCFYNLLAHTNLSNRQCCPASNIFFRYIHHDSISFFVKMIQLIFHAFHLSYLKNASRKASGGFLFRYQQISAPAGISFSGVIRERFPSASSAQRIIPSLRSPASLAGFRLVTTITFFPTISAGE